MPDLVDYKNPNRAAAYSLRCHRSRKPDYTDLRLQMSSALALEFLASLRTWLAQDDDEAIDYIYREVDTFLRKSEFSRVDDILRAVDISSLPVVSLLAFVSITNAPRSLLPARPGFVARVRQHLASVEPNRVEELLAGIE